MTKILAENANKDLFKGANNQLGILTDLDATIQACESIIETQRGELQYDINRGIPTDETLWSGVSNQQRFQFYCKEALLAIENVIGIKQFASEIVGNALVYEAIILTIFGEVTINGSL